MRLPIQKRRCHPRRRIAIHVGLTLIEVLVALVIFGSSVAVIYAAMGGQARTLDRIETEKDLQTLAKGLLSQRNSVGPGGWLQAGNQGPYSWRIDSRVVRSAEGLSPALHEVRLWIRWEAASGAVDREWTVWLPEQRRSPP